MSIWLIYALLGGIAANGVTIVNRYGLKDQQDPTAYAWWFEIIRLVIFLFILPFNVALIVSVKSFALLTILGFIEVVAVYVFMKMFAHTQLSVSTLISRLRLIWAPLFAALFLGEILSLSQYLGIALIFFGAIITSNGHSFKADQGIKYSLLFSVLSGLLSISMKSASTVASTSVIMIAMSIPSIFILPFLMKEPLVRIRSSFHSRFKHNLLATIFNVVSMYLYVEALRIGQVGLVFSVFNAMSVVAIIAGIIFLGERDNLSQKIIGTITAIGGIFLLA